MIKNQSAKVFYGMHFCPGVARYDEHSGLQVYLNENTIRNMNPTFSGKPVFVDHVDGVDEDLDEVRSEADGWVVRSFYNEADGKTWAEFIVTSERGLKAIARGYRLSNAYIYNKKGKGGLWNGVPYDEEITGAEYEHLALVQNPRYDESVVMTPEQFKEYNAEKIQDLKRLSNSKGGKKMSLSFFKRQKVENDLDLGSTLVELPKSKKVVEVEKCINAYDKLMNLQGFADQGHMVKLHDGSECSVGDLVKKHKKAMNDIDELKKAHEKEGKEIDEEMDNSDDDEDRVEDAMDESLDEDMKEVGDRGGDEGLENEDDDDERENSEDDDESSDEDDKKKNKKRKNQLSEAAKERIRRVKNAQAKAQDHKERGPAVFLTCDAILKGKQEYGSGK